MFLFVVVVGAWHTSVMEVETSRAWLDQTQTIFHVIVSVCVCLLFILFFVLCTDFNNSNIIYIFFKKLYSSSKSIHSFVSPR